MASLEGIGLSDYECGMIASGALLKYLEETQKNSLSHMSRLTRYATGNYMVLDSATRRNLELVETLREKQKRGSLLWVLDKTKTAMGARTLRKYVEQPLIDKKSIVKRLDAVAELKDNAICREETRQIKKKVEDSVISPFQTPRKPKYMFRNEYKNNKDLKEQPVDIYISSSWYDDGNWMWDIAKQALDAMKKHNGGLMLAFDESIAIKHELKTIEQLI